MSKVFLVLGLMLFAAEVWWGVYAGQHQLQFAVFFPIAFVLGAGVGASTYVGLLHSRYL